MSVKSPEARPRRGRPPAIDRPRIVAAALELGLGSFGLDDISAKLGVTTPALYRHVEGRDDIVRAAAGQVIVDLEPTLRELDHWEDWLRAWANGIRDRLGVVGEEVLQAVRTYVGEEALRVADHGLRLLIDAGIDPADAGYTLWLTLRLACTAGPAGQPSVAAAVDTAAAEPVPSATMADAMDRVALAAGDDSWRFDLDVLIEGVRARTA